MSQKFTVVVRSKTTFGTDTIIIDVVDVKDVADIADRAANNYGAEVISIHPEDPLLLLSGALRECLGFVDAWQSHLSDAGNDTAAATVAEVLARARMSYKYSKPA